MMNITPATFSEQALSVAEWYQLTSLLGFILMGIIVALVITMILASIFTKPRRSPVAGLVVASLIVMVAAAVIFAFILGVMLSAVVP